jgi:hypothetical protein
MIRKRLMSPALAGSGSLLAVALGISIDGRGQANAVMYSKQTGGPTTGKRPPIA